MKQGSQEWLAFRKEKVTGTRFGRSIAKDYKTRDGLIHDMIAEKYSNHRKEDYQSPEMSRGTEEEKFAAKEYESRFGVELEVIDMCRHEKYDWLLFSPDRYANNRTKYIEIKCPDSATMVEYTLSGEIPSKYKAQILLSFIVNEAQEECDLVIYDARFKEFNHQMTVINIKREDLADEISSAESMLEKFRKEWEEADQFYQNLIF